MEPVKGADLDRWAEHFGCRRRTVTIFEPHFIDPVTGARLEADETLRQRLLTLFRPPAD